MSAQDRQKWDAKHGQQQAGTPSTFLLALEAVLPRRGKALDVAGGLGRHALWLARRGLDVTLLDISPVALKRAAQAAAEEGLRLTTVAADLDTDPLPAGPWDLIVSVFFLWRPLFEVVPDLLAPGGLLVYAQPTRKNLERNPSPSARFLLEEGELPGLVRGLEVLRCEEGWFEEGRHEARLVARQPEA